MNDELFRQFEAAKAELEQLPSADKRNRARAAFLASATPNGAVRHSDHNSALLVAQEGDAKMSSRQSRRLRLIAAILLGVLLAGGLWSLPPLRTLAQGVIDFFIPDNDNTRSTEIYIGGHPPEPAERPSVDLESVIAAAPFEVHVPTYLPNGFRLDEVEIMNGAVFMKLKCRTPWSITIAQLPFTDETDLVPQEIGASAVIETVDIHGVEGQYVHGSWEVVLPENFETLRQNEQAQGIEVESVWNNDLPWGRLTWVADGIIFDVRSSGGTMSLESRNNPCAPSREMFMAIARGLVPNGGVR